MTIQYRFICVSVFLCLGLMGMPITAGAQSEPALKEYWPSGNLKSEEPLVNGKREGIAQYFHDNGQLYGEIPWKNGQKHGEFTLYRADGTKEQSSSYLDGKKNGLFAWHDENGNIYLEEAYVDDQLNGEVTKYHKNNNVSANLNYKDGVMHGENTWYFENGYVKVQANYKMGNLHGQGRWYNEDGSLRVSATYADGKVVSRTESPQKRTRRKSGWDLLFLVIFGIVVAIMEANKKNKKDSQGTRAKREKMAELSEKVASFMLGSEAWKDYKRKAGIQTEKRDNEEDAFSEMAPQEISPGETSSINASEISNYQDEFQGRFRSAIVLGWLAVGGVIFLGAVLYGQKYFQQDLGIAIQNSDTIKYILIGLSAVLLMLIPKIKSFILGETDHAQQPNFDAPRPSPTNLITKLMMAHIIVWAMCDAVAVCGFVLAILTNEMNNYYLFAVVALGGIMMNFPKQEEWEYWINNRLIGM